MSCPDDAEIVAFAQGLLDPADRSKVLDHIASCPECAGLAAEAARDERELGPATPGLPGDPWANLGEAEAPSELGRGTSIGRYVLLDSIGVGGLGQVFSAYDPELDRRVAIKLLKPHAKYHCTSDELRTRLVREAQALARVKHPNVVAVHDVGQANDQVFIAMELVEGQTLQEWLAESPRTWQEIRDIFVAAGHGLLAVHEAGLVHRDFKPTNVLIDGSGRVQVADFGLARAIDDPRGGDRDPPDVESSGSSRALEDSLTASGAIIGTPAYMAPEQHRGQDVDARADQFAFCVAMFEGLYGQRPFRGQTLQELLAAVRTQRLAAPKDERGTPPWLRRALVRGLSAEASDRFGSMRELLRQLQIDHSSRRRRWTTVVGVLGIAAGAVWLLSRPDGTAESDTRVDALVVEARGAAAKFRWVYPPLEDPAQPTAYVKVLELEQLAGDAEEIADARAQELRDEFAGTLVRLGDEYWDRPGGAIFATDYYAAALVFDEDHPTALERATLTFAQLGEVRRKAGELDFSPGELTAGDVLTALALPEASERDDAIERLYAQPPKPSATTTEALNALVGPLPLREDPPLVATAPRVEADPAVPEPPATTRPSKVPPRPNRDRQTPPRPEQAAPQPTGATSTETPRDPTGAMEEAKRGQAALKEGRLGEAERRFHAAVTKDRRNALALAGLGEVHFQREAFETSAKFFERAVKARPSSGRYRIDLGDVYLKVLRYRDAREQYVKAKELGDPKATKRIRRVDSKLGKVAGGD